MAEVVLQTEGLTKRYGDLTAVDDLTLAVYAGEVFGFLGPNGAGKTTSISMMCGLLQPTAGRVLVHGAPVDGGNPDVRGRVGVCPQEIILWQKLTCIEQLQFIGEMYNVPAAEARRRGEKLLEELELVEKRDRPAHTLSGGMQRRLNLAMALVHDPEIVVLDEPEAGLDPQSRVCVRDYIRSMAREKTVILTTHNMDEADRVADRVAIIDHGKLLVLDAPEALKQSIGAGDVLEISLRNGDGEKAKAALAHLDGKAALQVVHDTLTVRALKAAGLLPGVLDALAAAGIEIGEVRLRENTLEDVFIQLTGRRLRE